MLWVPSVRYGYAISSISSIRIAITAGSIKLFLFVQKSYQTIGIYLPQQNQNQNPLFNSKSVLLIIFSVQIFILLVISAIAQSQSIHEIALSFYLSTTSLLIIFTYVSNIFCFKSIFELIKKFEKFIEKSK